MSRQEPNGELYPRHMKALSALLRDHEKANPGSPIVKDAKEAMREVREIASQQKMNRRYRSF